MMLSPRRARLAFAGWSSARPMASAAAGRSIFQRLRDIKDRAERFGENIAADVGKAGEQARRAGDCVILECGEALQAGRHLRNLAGAVSGGPARGPEGGFQLVGLGLGIDGDRDDLPKSRSCGLHRQERGGDAKHLPAGIAETCGNRAGKRFQIALATLPGGAELIDLVAQLGQAALGLIQSARTARVTSAWLLLAMDPPQVIDDIRQIVSAHAEGGGFDAIGLGGIVRALQRRRIQAHLPPGEPIGNIIVVAAEAGADQSEDEIGDVSRRDASPS